jgi:chemotaxis protein CheZ
MEAAEAIGDWLREGARDPAAMAAIAERVNSIFEACTFQDVTGQRIRRAIQHLQQVETMLGGLVPEGGDAEAAEPEEIEPDWRAAADDLNQDEIDRLLA